MRQKKIKVENGVGTVLAHDVTRIVPGKFKGVGFRKGHIVREEDVPELLKLGKRYLYVLELNDDRLHEDAAALRIAESICGDGLEWSSPSEGKSNITARQDGLLKVDARGLLRINRLGNIIVSTLRTNFPGKKGQIVAATRIIPLTISRKKIEQLEAIARQYDPIIRIMPYRKFTVGAVVTGSEIATGLIKDEFDRYVGKKVEAYGSTVRKKINVTDRVRDIADAVSELKSIGCDLILTTGGMSVDPDDVTRKGVVKAGARVVAYGSPVLPGAMFLYAYLDEVPVLGLPACVYYHASTIFDLIFPRVLAGDEITRDTIAEMGHGGLCLQCDTCRFPDCPFGK